MKYTNLARKYGWKAATESYLKDPYFNLLMIVLGTITLVTGMIMVNYGFTQQEKVSCLKWEKLDKENAGFVASRGIRDACGQFQIYFLDK